MIEVLRTAIMDWFRHRSARLGAALAYYSVFSMGPLLLIITSVAGAFFGEDAVRSSLSGQFRSLLGEAGSQAVDAMLKGAGTRKSGQLAALTGTVLLIVAAVGVVAQLKDALDTIWDVPEPEDPGWSWYVRTYVVSLLGIMALGFLLAVSLVINTGLAAATAKLGATEESLGWQLASLALSMGVLALLFALLFRTFPDADVRWGDVWPGAVATAALFNAGKLAIAWYIGTQGFESTYGAAASLVVLLIWVYYSAQILLFGAELTHAYAKHRRQ